MIKVAVRFSYILIILLMTAGCWDRQEVDKLAIVTGLGIDLISGPEPYLITAQIVNLSSEKGGLTGGQESPFIISMAHGKTISEAIYNFSKESTRKIFYAHNNVIVLGEKLAQSSITDFMDYLDRSPQFRRNAWLIITPKTAKEVLQAECDLQKYSAIGLKEMIFERYHPFSNKMQRKDTMSRLEGLSAAALALKVDLVDSNQIETNKLKEAGNANTFQSQSKKEVEIPQRMQIGGFSVLSKDKLAGYLSDNETRGLLWYLGVHGGYPIRLSCPSTEQKSIVFLLTQTSKKLKPNIVSQPLEMKVEVGNYATVLENNCPEISLMNHKNIEDLENQLNETIKEQMFKTLEKLQRLGTDVVHFADAYYQENPAQWKLIASSYEKQFPEVQVQIDVKSKIRLTGMTSEALLKE